MLITICSALLLPASRLDHSAIYSLIAATYTPFVMLPIARVAGDVDGKQLLCRIWLGALCGVGKVRLWLIANSK
jgi:channel protein (hemolysin III family)